MNVARDPRNSFYSNTLNHSNIYAYSLGVVWGQYSHSFRAMKIQELVYLDRTLLRDGPLGGSNESIYQRWLVVETMHHNVIWSFFYKLIELIIDIYNNYSAASKSNSRYNWAHKFDLIFKAMIRNCNDVAKYADSHLCKDDTMFSHHGYGEVDNGLLQRLGYMKPGLTWGMQTVMIFDISRTQPIEV